MKRSEMEKVLATHIKNQFAVKEEMSYYEARIILTILEGQGLLPPRYLKQRHLGDIKFKAYANEWEPEDE